MLLANRFRGVSSSPHPYRRDDETTSRIEGVSRTFKGARTRIVSEVSGVRTQCFDYVIVGGGSAGCVLAARLSGDPTVKVALIEAGPPDDASEIHTPLAFPQLFKTQYDWDYATELEPWLDGRRVYMPRGRTPGGSSSINAMIYIRGNRVDFDDEHLLLLAAEQRKDAVRWQFSQKLAELEIVGEIGPPPFPAPPPPAQHRGA